MFDANAMSEWVHVGHDAVVGFAAIVGGLWAFARYRRERADEAALLLEIATVALPGSTASVVAVATTLRNVGKTRIRARANPTGQPAYDDGVERLGYNACLQVRKVAPSVASTAGRIDWFDPGCATVVSGIADINLLSEYENPRRNNDVEFWMEPGESYVLSSFLSLPAGYYLLKATFIGAGDDGDYWTRLASIAVP